VEVQILRISRKNVWYKDNIGDIFDVVDSGVYYEVVGRETLRIYPEDCVELASDDDMDFDDEHTLFKGMFKNN
jgi:hypothetical protein